MLGDHTNPIVLLDELDKANRGNNMDPIGPLYRLLETTSAHWEDLSLPGLRMDASHLVILATANETTQIESPRLK